ncbi:hypothetical protein [Bradyrhizobium elkanii]|uniref:hypothetical protein n=1 Tax=Bradyrhizobium elkanii TaxID=29448 RepID=UPI001BAA8C42|nr:hypothetical protein [Bradyrhizobium elkanii]MBR1164603.1 hypothetical protein [Bradyrhizobium elkanii]
MTKAVGFEADVKPLFSDSQQGCMIRTRGLDLHKYDDVKSWCERIIARLEDGTMPDDDTAPWPEDRIAIIKAWREQGFPV